MNEGQCNSHGLITTYLVCMSERRAENLRDVTHTHTRIKKEGAGTTCGRERSLVSKLFFIGNVLGKASDPGSVYI